MYYAIPIACLLKLICLLGSVYRAHLFKCSLLDSRAGNAKLNAAIPTRPWLGPDCSSLRGGFVWYRQVVSLAPGMYRSIHWCVYSSRAPQHLSRLFAYFSLTSHRAYGRQVLVKDWRSRSTTCVPFWWSDRTEAVVSRYDWTTIPREYRVRYMCITTVKTFLWAHSSLPLLGPLFHSDLAWLKSGVSWREHDKQLRRNWGGVRQIWHGVVFILVWPIAIHLRYIKWEDVLPLILHWMVLILIKLYTR